MNRRNMICIMEKMNLDMLDDDSLKYIIDGNDIKNENDFYNVIGKHFDFPKFDNVESYSLHGFIDFMTDLYWLELKFGKLDNICLIIKNYSKLFNGNIEDIYFYVIDIFSTSIINFWDGEFFDRTNNPNHLKKFNVYLVEELI